jgi:hypothetical protein
MKRVVRKGLKDIIVDEVPDSALLPRHAVPIPILDPLAVPRNRTVPILPDMGNGNPHWLNAHIPARWARRATR